MQGHDTRLFFYFNVKVGREADIYSGAIRKVSLLSVSNDNGTRMACFALEHVMVIGGIAFKNNMVISEVGSQRMEMNYMFMRRKFRPSFHEVRVRKGAEAIRDHMPFVAEVKLKKT